MSTPIDRLEVQVQAEASNANKQLDMLINRLEKVSSALGGIRTGSLENMATGISKLSTAMQQMKTVNSADFSRLSRNIEKLSTVNTAGIQKAASALRDITSAVGKANGTTDNVAQLANLTSSISRLGSKSITNATTNLPLLSKSLTEFMTSMSKAPKVSGNLIKMTDSLANLSTQGRKAGSAASALNRSVNSYSSKAKVATASTKSLANSMASLYAKLWLVRKAFSFIWNSTESAMNFIETLDLFNVAVSKVAKDVKTDDWKKLGFKSAQDYEKAFVDEMYGFTEQITDKIGIYQGELLQYSALFAQMANSMGVSSESAKDLSMSFTALGEDMASLWNLDVSKAMDKLKSGLAGQVRPLRELGIDITQTSLQQTAYTYGIKDNVSAMSQAAKVQLRYLTIMEQTKVSWGNMADTIETPANQLRLLQERFKSLCTTIGSLFLPIVSAILPIVNAVTMALNTMLKGLGSLLGIDMSNMTGTTGYKVDDSMLDYYDDVETGADNATKAAEKYRKTIASFDEITKLNEESSSSGSGSGGGAGVGGGYPALDEAIKNMSNGYLSLFNSEMNKINDSATSMANAIVNYFKKIQKAATPTTKAIKKLWNEGFSKLASFTWTNLKNFYNNFLVPVGTWTLGEKGLARFFNITNDMLKKISWTRLNKSLSEFQKVLANITIFTFDAILDFYDGFLAPVATWTLGKALPSLLDCITKLANAINWDYLNGAFNDLWKALGKFAIGVGSGLVNFAQNLTTIMTPVLSVTVDLFATALKALAFAIDLIPTPIVEALGGALGGLCIALLGFKAATGISSIITGIGASISGALALISAHPVVAIAAGVAALAGAVISLFSVDDDPVDELTQKINDNITAYKEWVVVADEKIKQAGTQEAATLQRLGEEYIALMKKEKLTADEQERLNQLKKYMINLYPELETTLNNEKASIEDVTTAINNKCIAIVKEAKIEAYREKITGLYKQQEEATKNVNKAYEEQQVALAKSKKATEELERAQGIINGTIEDTNDELEWLNKGGYGSLQKAVKDSGDELTRANTKLSEAGGNYSELQGEIKKTTDKIMEIESATELADFSPLPENVQKAVKDVNKALNSSNSDIKKSAAGIASKVISTLSGSNGFRISGNISWALWNMGDFVVKGLNKGINDNKGTAVGPVQSLGTLVLNTFKNMMEQKSPSKAFARFGKFNVLGFNNGINKYANTSVKAVEKWGDKILSASEDTLTLSTGVNYELNTSGIKGYDTMLKDTYIKGNVSMHEKIDSEVSVKISEVDAHLIAKAIADKMIPVVHGSKSNVTVKVDPNSKGIFNIVVEENDKSVNSTGLSPLFSF